MLAVTILVLRVSSSLRFPSWAGRFTLMVGIKISERELAAQKSLDFCEITTRSGRPKTGVYQTRITDWA